MYARRWSDHDERAYDRWLEAREEEELDEEWEAWCADVDEHCTCAWEDENVDVDQERYRKVPTVAPDHQCHLHAQAAKEEEEREERVGRYWEHNWAAHEVEEPEPPSLDARIKAEEARLREVQGPHEWADTIIFIKARLNVADTLHLAVERIPVLREVFLFLAQPAQRPFLVQYPKFRAVVQAKINELRGHPKGEQLEDVFDPVEAILEDIAREEVVGSVQR